MKVKLDLVPDDNLLIRFDLPDELITQQYVEITSTELLQAIRLLKHKQDGTLEYLLPFLP